MYSLAIDAVDGERAYTIQTPDPAEAMAFGMKYDHEGSSVSLTVVKPNEPPHTHYGDVYAVLRGERKV